VEHIAILEYQPSTWYVHVPAIGTGVAVGEPSAACDSAARLIARTTGCAPGELLMAVRLVRTSDVLVSVASSPVNARHVDGVRHLGQCRGWIRQADRSWRALISYVVDGVQWERALSLNQFTWLNAPDRRGPRVSAACDQEAERGAAIPS
jgi:hypothetical protein